MEDKEVKELEKALEQIWDIAIEFGLDPFPTKFEVVPATVMYEIGSYALPGRYSHWTFGKAYHRMKTMYDFGLSKIYEVVINTNPSFGFLLETNSLLQNKLVIAHVMGHVDFFKNNMWFSKTNRRMLETVSAHTERMNGYEFKYGRKAVEKFLDAVLAIEEHIDPDFFIKREAAIIEEKKERPAKKEGKYEDLLTMGQAKEEEEPDTEKQLQQKREKLPEKDIVYYIMKNSPVLQPWQRDVISMIHEEMEYFVPQMQTKIANEGWASYWHSRIMREMDLPDADHMEFADLHSSVVSPHKGQLNPYYIGYKIWEDIEKRFGRAKMFEVREVDNDISFLRNYLTEELCEELDLFVFELVDEEEWTITEKKWERVRDQLVANMTNFSFPYLVVEDGDYNGNRELYLKHRYEGAELDESYARKAMEHVFTLWGRPVHLETIVDEESRVLHFDGSDHSDSYKYLS